MKQDLQIKKWMLEGLTDRQIEAKLKVIKDKEEDDFQVHMVAVMDDDEPSPAPGPVSDTVQGMFDRVVAAIDKVDVVKDNGSATGGEVIKFGINSSGAGIGFTNTNSTADPVGIAWEGLTGIPLRVVNTSSGGLDRLDVAPPTEDTNAATKKYVDEGQTVKDLTHLTTQAQIYAATVRGGIYKMPQKVIKGWTTFEPLMICHTHDNTKAVFNGLTNFPGELYTLQTTMLKAGTGVALIDYIPMYIGEPTSIHHAATKHYVDNKVTAIEYDTKLYSFTAAAHTFKPDAGWEFVAITQVEVTYDTNYKYIASDVGATSTSGEFEFHGATPKEGVFTYNFDKAAQTITIAQSANFNGLGTGGNIRMLVRKVA